MASVARAIDASSAALDCSLLAALEVATASGAAEKSFICVLRSFVNCGAHRRFRVAQLQVSCGMTLAHAGLACVTAKLGRPVLRFDPAATGPRRRLKISCNGKRARGGAGHAIRSSCDQNSA
jgi:hypothetical protein